MIKAGEEFTLSLLDPNQEEPDDLGDLQRSYIGGSSAVSMPRWMAARSRPRSTEEGYYDVNRHEERTGASSCTGAMSKSRPRARVPSPRLTDFHRLGDQHHADRAPAMPVTLSYDRQERRRYRIARLAASKDPYMFRIPAEFLPMTHKAPTRSAMWIKPEKFSSCPTRYGPHGPDADLDIGLAATTTGERYLGRRLARDIQRTRQARLCGTPTSSRTRCTEVLPM